MSVPKLMQKLQNLDMTVSSPCNFKLTLGVPLEDIFPGGDIHPQLKILLVEIHESLLLTETPVWKVLQHEPMELMPVGSLLRLLKHFLGSLPLPLLPNYTDGVNFAWLKISDMCRMSFERYLRDKRSNEYLIDRLAHELLKLPRVNLLLIGYLVNFLRSLVVQRQKFNKISTLALVKYFGPSIFVRPYRFGRAAKKEEIYRPLFLYLLIRWPAIQQRCMQRQPQCFVPASKRLESYQSYKRMALKKFKKLFEDAGTQTNVILDTIREEGLENKRGSSVNMLTSELCDSETSESYVTLPDTNYLKDRCVQTELSLIGRREITLTFKKVGGGSVHYGWRRDLTGVNNNLTGGYNDLTGVNNDLTSGFNNSTGVNDDLTGVNLTGVEGMFRKTTPGGNKGNEYFYDYEGIDLIPEASNEETTSLDDFRHKRRSFVSSSLLNNDQSKNRLSFAEDCKEEKPMPDTLNKKNKTFLKEDFNALDSNKEDGNVLDGKKEDGNVLGGKKGDSNVLDGKKEDGNVFDGKKEESNVFDGKKEKCNVLDGKKEDGNVFHGKKEDCNVSSGKKEDCNDMDGKKEECNIFNVNKEDCNVFLNEKKQNCNEKKAHNKSLLEASLSKVSVVSSTFNSFARRLSGLAHRISSSKSINQPEENNEIREEQKPEESNTMKHKEAKKKVWENCHKEINEYLNKKETGSKKISGEESEAKTKRRKKSAKSKRKKSVETKHWEDYKEEIDKYLVMLQEIKLKHEISEEAKRKRNKRSKKQLNPSLRSVKKQELKVRKRLQHEDRNQLKLQWEESEDETAQRRKLKIKTQERRKKNTSPEYKKVRRYWEDLEAAPKRRMDDSLRNLKKVHNEEEKVERRLKRATEKNLSNNEEEAEAEIVKTVKDKQNMKKINTNNVKESRRKHNNPNRSKHLLEDAKNKPSSTDVTKKEPNVKSQQKTKEGIESDTELQIHCSRIGWTYITNYKPSESQDLIDLGPLFSNQSVKPQNNGVQEVASKPLAKEDAKFVYTPNAEYNQTCFLNARDEVSLCGASSPNVTNEEPETPLHSVKSRKGSSLTLFRLRSKMDLSKLFKPKKLYASASDEQLFFSPRKRRSGSSGVKYMKIGSGRATTF